MSERKPERIVVAWHPNIPKAAPEAEKIADAIANRGLQRPDVARLNDSGFRSRLKEDRYDLVIALGGDGTMIRTGKLCARNRIPVMGINMGSVGFLIDTQANEWEQCLDHLLSGEWRCEKRMMLHAEVIQSGQRGVTSEVLNEVIVTRGNSIRPIHLSAEISGTPLTEYVADGLIIATATGSTAYAMAASGPVLQPEMRSMLLLPVAPHLCMDHSLVLPEEESIKVTVTGETDMVFCPDGTQVTHLNTGDSVIVRASENSVLFVRFEDKGAFYQKLTGYMQRNPAAERKNP